MLVNPRVLRIEVNYKAGTCMLYMENGEVYGSKKIRDQKQLGKYLKELIEDDGFVITDAVPFEYISGNSRMKANGLGFLSR